MTRLQHAQTVISIVRDVLLCIVLIGAIIFGTAFVRTLSGQQQEERPLPDYCYTDSASRTNPECQED